MAALRWALWPLGLALVLLRAPEAIVPAAAFLPLAAAYVAGAAWLVAPRSAGAPAGSAAQWLIGGGVVIFSLAGLSGAPTAEHPGAMVANTAALLLAALCLLVGAIGLACGLWDGPGRTAAGTGAAVLGLGSALYLVNLLFRLAVVLAGWAPEQAAVEDQAWQAHRYLTGLAADDRPMVLLLVFVDLLQVAYVISTFVAVACFAGALRRAGRLSARAARLLGGGAVAASVAVLVGMVGAGALITGEPTSGRWHEIGAGVAFGLTIPFVTTLLPHLLGVSLLPVAAGGRSTAPAARRRPSSAGLGIGAG